MRGIWVLVAALGLYGCDESMGTDAGPSTDAGPAPDSGPMPDAGPMADAGPMPDGGPATDCAGAPANFDIGSGWTLLDAIDPRAVGIPAFGEGTSAHIVVRDCVVDLFQGDNGTDTWTLLQYTNEADGFERILGPGIGPDNLEEIERLEIVGDHYFAIGMEGSAPYMVTMPIGGTVFSDVTFSTGPGASLGWAALDTNVYVAGPGGVLRTTMADITGGTIDASAAADRVGGNLYRFGDAPYAGGELDRTCLDGIIDGGGGDASVCVTDESLTRPIVTREVVLTSGTGSITVRRPGAAAQMVTIPELGPAGTFDAYSDGAGNLVVGFETTDSATIAHITNLDGTPTVNVLPDMTSRLYDPEIISVWTNGTHALALVLGMTMGRRLELYGTPL